MFFIIDWDIWFLFAQEWAQCLILTGMAAAGFLVIFAAAVVIVLLEPAREGHRRIHPLVTYQHKIMIFRGLFRFFW